MVRGVSCHSAAVYKCNDLCRQRSYSVGIGMRGRRRNEEIGWRNAFFLQGTTGTSHRRDIAG